MQQGKMRFGQHLIFDAYGCSFAVLNSAEACKTILEDVVKIAQMHKLLDPVIVKATSNEESGGKDPGGFTGFVIIQESHVSIHTFARRGFATIDLYSCRNFETVAIVEYLVAQLKPEDYDILNLERGLKYPVANIY